LRTAPFAVVSGACRNRLDSVIIIFHLRTYEAFGTILRGISRTMDG